MPTSASSSPASAKVVVVSMAFLTAREFARRECYLVISLARTLKSLALLGPRSCVTVSLRHSFRKPATEYQPVIGLGRAAHARWTAEAVARAALRNPLQPTCESCHLVFSSAAAYSEHLSQKRHALTLLQTRHSSLFAGERVADSRPWVARDIPPENSLSAKDLVRQSNLAPRRNANVQPSTLPKRVVRAITARRRAERQANYLSTSNRARTSASGRMSSGAGRSVVAERMAEIRYFLEYSSHR